MIATSFKSRGFYILLNDAVNGPAPAAGKPLAYACGIHWASRI